MRVLACVQVGAIVPWNYPFHNVLNPLTAALFAGNSLVIKVCVCVCELCVTVCNVYVCMRTRARV